MAGQSKLQSLMRFTAQPRGRAIVFALAAAGGCAGVYAWRRLSSRKKGGSKRTTTGSADEEKRVSSGGKGAFVQRLGAIIKILVPRYLSKEFALVVVLSVLLIARTILSVILSDLIGTNIKFLVTKKWKRAMRGAFFFFLLSLPGAFINSMIKHTSQILSLKFRCRLSLHINEKYIRGVNFYSACNLRGMSDVDQRVTTDIQVFCEEIANLYSAVFKPILDIVLFTNQLAHVTGWQGPVLMYSYFAASAWLKKIINTQARFSRLVSRESSLEGKHRAAHQRLITNSEEVAFYGGSERERDLIQDVLRQLYQYSKLHRHVRFIVGVADQLLVKYWASLAGYFVMWIPILMNPSDKSTSELTRDYVRISRYLENLASAVGNLVLVINKLATIAGRTKRVSEILELVDELESTPREPFNARELESTDKVNPYLDGIDAWLKDWEHRLTIEREARQARMRREEGRVRTLPGGGTYERGDIIEFKDVDVVSPEGSVLAKSLSFKVEHQHNVMVTGPNGAGKSSLFRVIGELWPLSSGTVVKPSAEDVLFVPQKPYLVDGTLRDQIIYPDDANTMEARGISDDDLAHLLAVVDPANDILSTWDFDDEKDWFRAFSGGQKQRVAMARVFYHRPLYAILDECTSAVSSEVENKIYETCRVLGITIFTVSHRESLRIHHDFILRIEGYNGKWTMTKVE